LSVQTGPVSIKIFRHFVPDTQFDHKKVSLADPATSNAANDRGLVVTLVTIEQKSERKLRLLHACSPVKRISKLFYDKQAKTFATQLHHDLHGGSNILDRRKDEFERDADKISVGSVPDE
jgi:hypothetical protein